MLYIDTLVAEMKSKGIPVGVHDRRGRVKPIKYPKTSYLKGGVSNYLRIHTEGASSKCQIDQQKEADRD